MSSDSLSAWATTAGGRKVLAEARRRIEGGSQLARGKLRVALTQSERHEVGALLGVAWEVSGQDVSITALHRALEARGMTLRALLESGAPLRDRPAERQAARTAAEAERIRACEMLTTVGIRPAVAQRALTRRGLPRAGTGELVALAEKAALVWSKLPGEDSPILLAKLVGDLFGNTHDLDRSTSLGRTLARLASGRDLESEGLGSIDATSAAGWRAAWASVGVLCDEVSSLALILNLRLEGEAAATHISAVEGEPVWISLRSLRGRWTPTVRAVWVCENPSIVEAAADRLGKRCPPLICTFGRPSVAALELLRGCAAAGVAIRIRADDDAAGQSIVAKLLALAPDAQMWRYEVRSPKIASESPVYEEQLLSQLLTDLESAANSES